LKPLQVSVYDLKKEMGVTDHVIEVKVIGMDVGFARLRIGMSAEVGKVLVGLKTYHMGCS